jgi:hypothetical protein
MAGAQSRPIKEHLAEGNEDTAVRHAHRQRARRSERLQD